MNLSIKVDQGSLNETKIALAKAEGIYPKVVSRAINKSLVTVRAAAVSRIYEEVNITRARIVDTFQIFKATYSSPSGAVSSKAKPTPLSYFSDVRALAKGKGVSVRILRKGDIEKFKHAFIAKMSSGHVGVFEREQWFGRAWKPLLGYHHLPHDYRLPIDEMFSLRITDVFAREQVIREIDDLAMVTYLDNCKHELDYELSQL